MTIELDNPVDVFFREITDKSVNQRSIAITYAFIIAQEPNADWPAINASIRERWKGKTALTRIKELAWRHVEGWAEKGREQ